MEDERLPTPALGQPQWFGQPYHGLVIDGQLALPTGRSIDVPGVSGDCYIVKVPGTPPVDITPLEAAREAASGRQWRDYALLSGRDKRYAGIIVGADAWLYAAEDGTVWRIRCPQLDNALVRATPDPAFIFGWFPSELDFEFQIERFGLIGGEPDTAVIVLPNQSLGGPIQSDVMRDSMYGERLPPAQRRFPGDGYMTQWMPINIEDVNSTGARCLICCNRTREQSAVNLPPQFGRAYPQAWLEIAVSGGGSADQITISMSVARVQSSAAQYSSDRAHGTWPDGASFDSISSHTFFWGKDVPYVSQETTSINVPMRVAGGYYGADDALEWATLSAEIHRVGSAICSASMMDTSVSGGVGTGYVRRQVGVMQLDTADVSIQIGGHAWVVPQLRIESSSSHTVSESIYGANYPNQPAEIYTVHVSVSGVFGSSDRTGNGFHEFEGSFLPGAGFGIGIFDVSPSVVDGACGRSVDNVRLVRMTNKTYVVMARWDLSWGPVGLLQEVVLAVGGPNGWVGVNQLLSDYQASYNPGTGELSHGSANARGWI